MKNKREKNCMGFYLVAHQTNAPPAPSADAHLPRSAAQAQSQGSDLPRVVAAPPRRRPATEGQSESPSLVLNN